LDLTPPGVILAPRSVSEVLDHKPCQPSFAIVGKISQSLRSIGIASVAFSPISGNSMQSVGIVGARTTGPANGQRRHDEKGTGVDR
jgi:hypothetical protein